MACLATIQPMPSFPADTRSSARTERNVSHVELRGALHDLILPERSGRRLLVRRFALGHRLGHPDVSRPERGAVEAGNGRVKILRGRHVHKGKPPRISRRLVARDVDELHLPVRLEERPDVVIRLFCAIDAERQRKQPLG